MAEGVVAGTGLVDNWGNRAMYNVGYPLFILSPLFALFGPELLVVRLANVVLGVVTILLTYLVAMEAGAGRVGRLLASAIAALYLPATVYVVYLFKENLLAPLMLGVVWCALRLTVAPTTPVAVACGALLGVVALTGNAALTLLGAVMTALYLSAGDPRFRIFLLVTTIVVAGTVTAPWVIRNAQVIGSPVLNTNGGFNLYLGNNEAATGAFISIADTPRGATWEEFRLQVGEVAASEALRDEALQWIKDHPAQFGVLVIKKAYMFWAPPLHAGKGPTSSAEALARVMWTLQFFLVAGLAAGSLFFSELRGRRLAVLVVAVLCYSAVHSIFYVILRYREPIMPILGVLAALSADAIWARLSRRQRLL